MSEVNKFKLINKEYAPGWWILYCAEYGLTIVFEEHRFNETQQVSFSDERSVVERLGAQGVAALMREAGDWLYEHAYSIAMPTPAFEFRKDDEGNEFLLRNKFPRLSVEIKEACDVKQLSDALRAASEFVRKRRKDG